MTFLKVPEDGGEAAFVSYLAGQNDGTSLASGDVTADSLAKLRNTLREEADLVVAFGAELRAEQIAALVTALPNAKFICLGDYANSRGAADMGLYPDLLPGYTPLANAARFEQEWGMPLPSQAGLDLRSMFDAAAKDQIK